jgi:hypothetical protein
MKIETLNDLTACVKMCRKNGVRSIEIDGIKMTLDELVTESKNIEGKEAELKPAYTDEEILTWSSAPHEGQ